LSNKKWYASTLGAVLVMASISGCGVHSSTDNTVNGTSVTNTVGSAQMPPEPHYTGQVVATYAGGQLTKPELDAQYNLQVVLPGLDKQESKKDFVTYYVVWYKYLYGQASKEPGFTYDPKQAQSMVDQSVQQMLGTNYKTADDVYAKMKDLGLSKNDLLLLAAKGEALKVYLTKQMQGVTVSDSDAKAYYAAHKSDFVQVTVNHVLVASLDEAKKVEAQLKAGADFAKTADKYSTDPGVKQNHGAYADQLASTFVTEFAKAAETLPIGQISDPVHTQFGYHVMRVDKRTQQSFDQVKDTIVKQMLPQLQQQKEQSIYKAATTAAKIQIKAKDADL
jgi:foldase protein PrsA